MKKLYFGMLLMAGLALTACSSDDNSTEPQAPKTYYMTVDASKAVNEAFSRMSTRALSLTGSTLSASWETTEKVYVQGQLTGGSYFWFENYIQPQSVGKTTRLNGTVSLPDGWKYSSIEAATGAHPTLTLQFPRPDKFDYTGQIGMLADIAAKYDYATTTIEVVVDNDRIVPYEEKTAVFANQQAIVKFTLKNADGTLLNPSALNVRVVETKDGYPVEEETINEIELSSIPEATYTTNGNGVLFVAIPGFSSKKVILTATVGGTTYTFTKSGVTFNDGKYYEINVKMKK